jgi:hypothetical protein
LFSNAKDAKPAWTSGLALFNADGLVLKGSQTSTGKTDVELSPGPLAAGHYFLLVSGTVLSNSASYTGSAA